MEEIRRREEYTLGMINQVRERLASAEDILGDRACVYATGSFGRLEARTDSDLDLFIVGIDDENSEQRPLKSRLPHLDEICIKADLIRATRSLGIKDFDGDGRYLVHYSSDEFTKTLGTREDDVNNTMTGRLLMLLESQALLGRSAYETVIRNIIRAYWRDYEDHKTDFMPAYLTNDILRLWRTFCVNYEARTERRPDPQKAKGKVKNFKLKHSRMITCYSALLYLLTVYKIHGTVSKQQGFEMTQLTPLARIKWLLEQDAAAASHLEAEKLLAQYNRFLELTSVGESELEHVFSSRSRSEDYMSESRKFGDYMYSTLSNIDETNRYYRIIVV